MQFKINRLGHVLADKISDTKVNIEKKQARTYDVIEGDLDRASLRDDTSLRWTRVHDLPDFVYFNHSIHVKKGMGCETCHGRVDQMPLVEQVSSLQMDWCLNCHRAPEQFVRPRSEIFTMGYRPAVPQAVLGPQLVKEYQIQPSIACSTCHR